MFIFLLARETSIPYCYSLVLHLHFLRWPHLNLHHHSAKSITAKSFTMSDEFYIPGPMSPDSPPARTGSHPIEFIPAPFAMRPDPPYPRRPYYAAIDPLHAAPNATFTFDAPAPIERRAGSEPHTGWRRQNVEVDTRRISIPPALEVAPLTFRERLPYPVRSVDEMTTWMPPPVVEPQRNDSGPLTQAEMRAVGPHTQDDWGSYGWWHENGRRETTDVGPDRSRFTMHGGREDPNETAAVPTETVMESIEVEGDQLIAMRQLRDESQRVIRGQQDEIIDLEERNEAIRRRNQYLERSRVEADNNLAAAIRERNQARNQAQRLRGELEAMPPHGPAQQGAHGNGRQEETSRIEDLERANRRLRDARNMHRDRADQLESDRDQLMIDRNRYYNQRTHLEAVSDFYLTQRNRYRMERDQERNQNQMLQAHFQHLNDRLIAAQNVAHVPPQSPSPPPDCTHPIDPPPAVAPPPIELPVNPPPVAPPTAVPQIIAPPAAPAGSDTGGRGGRGRGGAVSRRGRGGRREAATREQPKRTCKVVKSYRGKM